MAREVFAVTQKDTYEGTSWVEGVFSTRELAEAYIVTQKTELAEDDMEEAYEFSVEPTFLMEK